MPPATKREQRIRRAILRLVDAAKPGVIRGRFLADLLTDQRALAITEGADADVEITRLAMDLVNLGMIEATDARKLKTDRAGIDWMEYQVTAKGTRLLAGLEPVEPLIEDERL